MKNENCLVGGKSNDLVKKRAFEDISGYNKGASPSPNKMRKPQNPKKSFQSFKMRKSAAVTQKEPSNSRWITQMPSNWTQTLPQLA